MFADYYLTMIKLFVGGFPLDMDEMGLATLFGPYGDLSTVTIVRDRATKICKGYGFIEMKTQEGADEAVAALNGTQLGDRVLTVKTATEKPQPSKPSYKPVTPFKRPYNADDQQRKKRPRRSMD